jgi:hypothetical protein
MTSKEVDVTAIPGWFLRQDQILFRWFLEEQNLRQITGDLAEFGVYLGKSAIVVGAYLRPGETFTVIDLFESPSHDSANQTENVNTYSSLTQRAFEANYLRFHERLPVVIRGPSSEILNHSAVGRHRFVHADASHLYEHVRTDVASARALLHEHGLVVFDDIQSDHTPGVAAAVWAAVDNNGLRPIVKSQGKLYGTWGAAESWQNELLTWLPVSGLEHEVQEVAGGPLIRVWQSAASGVARRVWRTLAPRGVREYRETRRQARL